MTSIALIVVSSPNFLKLQPIFSAALTNWKGYGQCVISNLLSLNEVDYIRFNGSYVRGKHGGMMAIVKQCSKRYNKLNFNIIWYWSLLN